jgi:hypothetical protein
LQHKDLNLKATLNKGGADFIIISTLTDYIARKNFFDKSSVESVVEDFKSIIPVSELSKRAQAFDNLLRHSAIKTDIEVLLTNPSAAEGLSCSQILT